MASSSKDSGGKVKKKLWEETPNTFTEFGALSSDMRPSGNFFSRLWKRNKDGGNQSPASSVTNLHDDSLLGRSNNSLYSEASVPTNIVTPLPLGRLSRQGSRSSTLVDDDALSTASAPAATGGRLDQSEEVYDNQDGENRVQPRTLTSVLTRLGSILDHRSSTPQTYKDSDFKQYWMPDSSCKECYDCGDKFTTFRRRHHCRICGQIFCSKCCNQELSGKIIGYKGGIRVCTYCCRVVQRYAQQSASTGDAKALEELRAFSQLYHDSGSFEFGHRSQSPRLSTGDLSPQMRGDSLPDLAGMVASDMNTPFDLTPQSEFSSQESLMLESKLLIQDSVQLRELWRQISDPEMGIETQTLRIRLRVHQNCIVGKELVDWLIKRDKAATRDQAIAIGQAFLIAGFLDCVGSQLPVFKDDFTLYRHGEMATSFDLLGEPETVPTMTEEKNEPLWFQQLGKSDDATVDSLTSTDERHSNTPEAETQKSNSSGSDVRTLLDTEASRSGSFSEMPKAVNLMSRDMVEEPLPRQDSSVHGLGDDFLKGALFLGKPPMPSSDVVTCPHGWRVVEQLREENGEKLAYERLKKAHTELWDSLTRQLLSQNSLLLSWESVISTCITQVSHFVRPDVRLEGDDMDIRNYVHVKKVPGGSKKDTSLFHGVIFTKNVAHKKMKTKIVNPLILLLRGTIEFQRVENKFSSLEPQILQEREFMRNCVMKMIAYRPNVVVVEKSVSRLAQEYLLEAGITLLFNVKLSVMERLARFTQADIVPSIDGLVSRPKLGFCHDFRVETYNLPTGEAKTLAIFDGCATHLGCTIVLRGGTLSELRRVKKILKFMTYTAYNSLLELCFCMDEFALPQPGADEIGQPFEGLENSEEYKKDNQTSFGSIRGEEMAFEKNSEDSDTNTYETVEFHIETDSDLEMELVGLETGKKNSGNFSSETVTSKDSNPQGQAQTNVGSQPSDLAPDGKQESSRGRSRSLNAGKMDKGERSSSGLSTTEGQKSHDRDKEENSKEPTEKRSRHGSEPVRAKGDMEETKKTQNSTDAIGTTNTEVEKAFHSNALLSVACEHHFGAADTTPQTTTTSTNSTASVADNRPTFPGMDYLSAVAPATGSASHREKIRHSSGVSTADDISGRSTPDCVFRNTEETSWDGAPKVIGNIVCIIPKSALPVSAIAPPQTDGSGTSEKQKSKSSSDVPPSNDSSSKACEERMYTNSPSTVSGDEKLISRNSSVDSVNKDSSSKSSQEGSQPSSLTVSNIGQKKQERSASEGLPFRPSTSKLTQLTDFSDPLLGYQNTLDESIFSSKSTQKIALTEIKQSKYKRFRKALDGVHLSISPYHKYSVPFIETDKGSHCAVRKYLPDEIFWSSLFDGEGDQRPVKSKLGDELPSKYSNKNHIQILECHPLITCKLTEPIWEPETQSILADFRARGGRIHVMPNNFGRHPPPIEHVYRKGEDNAGIDQPFVGPMWEKKDDCLSPMNHQKLMVLFSSYSYKSVNHPFPCVYPWVVTMEFYAKNDITLGGFLERFCFRKQYTCPSPSCDTPMTDHVRRFVHGNACVNVLLKKLDNDVPGGKDNILMWSWCRKCKQVTPVVPISGDTWSLSFAKYLDLRFHSSSFMRRASAEPCMHSLHHDHFQYFGHRNIVASFKFAYISLKELALPASTVTVQPPVFDPVKLTEQVRGILYKATEKYSIMVENTMKLKHELSNENQIKILSDILTEQQNDKKSFRDSATNIQMKIQELIHSVTVQASSEHGDSDLSFHLNSIFDNIELLKRHICEDVSKWNTRMQEFMVHHQKKSRAQTSNKKDRDSGTSNIDELEKSWKSVTDRNFSKAPVPPSPVLPPKVGHGQSVTPPQLATTTTTTAPQSDVSTTAASANLASAPASSDISKTAEDQTKGTSGDASTTETSNTTTAQDVATTATTATTPPIPKVHVTEPAPVVPATGPPPTTALATTSILPPPIAAEAVTSTLPNSTRNGTKSELNEHHNLPMCERVPIVVYENEPSSIIAYALSSSDYLCRLREIQTAARPNSSDPTSVGSQTSKQNPKLSDPAFITGQGTEANTETGRKGGMLSFLRGSSRDPSPLHTAHQGNTSVDTVRYVPGADWGDSVNIEDPDMPGLSDETAPAQDQKTKVGNAATSPHIELQFSDSTAKFYCRVYFADQFMKLRRLICPGSDNIFIRSLSRCKPWEAKGGKSGSSFSKTDDDRFILKQMSNMEVESFEKFGPQYFQYIQVCTHEQQPTALAKILGVFRIGFRNSQTNHSLRQDVLVMENLFYNRKISQKFDLKGSMRNRMVNTTSKRAEEELVLLDENLLKGSVESPLYLRPHSKLVLKSAITSDSTFLSTNLVMDYSLLVGVDASTQEMVVGIIDYIRTFTWDKKLEMVVKSSGILGGQGKMPTVVSPQLYRGRFLEAMDRYFLNVPDHWTGLGRDSPPHRTKVDTYEN